MCLWMTIEHICMREVITQGSTSQSVRWLPNVCPGLSQRVVSHLNPGWRAMPWRRTWGHNQALWMPLQSKSVERDTSMHTFSFSQVPHTSFPHWPPQVPATYPPLRSSTPFTPISCSSSSSSRSKPKSPGAGSLSSNHLSQITTALMVKKMNLKWKTCKFNYSVTFSWVCQCGGFIQNCGWLDLNNQIRWTSLIRLHPTLFLAITKQSSGSVGLVLHPQLLLRTKIWISLDWPKRVSAI